MNTKSIKVTRSHLGRAVALSISDDDLCSTCCHLEYRPGEMSHCSKLWPGWFDADNYCRRCPRYSQRAAVDVTEQGLTLSTLALACEKLVSTVRATGGVFEEKSTRMVVPAGDPEWADLGDAIMAADHALERYYADGNPPMLEDNEQPRLGIQYQDDYADT